jgi:hypothetical protein
MRDDRQMFELDRRRPDDRVQRLAGRIGDEMEVEPVCGHLGTLSGLAGVKQERSRARHLGAGIRATLACHVEDEPRLNPSIMVFTN